MTQPGAPLAIERVGEGDLDALLPLMRAYCDFYEAAPSDQDLRHLSGALIASDGRDGLQLLARDAGGEAIAFATLLFTWSTTSAARAAVMNDLYVTPHARGTGIADALIRRCILESERRDVAKLTWLTRPENGRAQAVYERSGAYREPWVNYRVDLPAVDPAGA